ncbi:MAG: hypothetical protein KBD76_09220 [Bacteriovorax sp.]|nr:hypothetical protein [Bacteriovorax sp.]
MERRFLRYIFHDSINLLIKYISVLQRICKMVLIAFLFGSCGFKVSSVGSNILSGSGSVISGVISPLVGSIAEDKSQRNLFLVSAFATSCAAPVYAKLYDLQSDGSIVEDTPLSTQEVTSNAKYSFNLSDLNLSHSSQQVEYLVKVEGCNGDVYKRPITSIDSNQDLNAVTTVVAEVINSSSLLTKTLNQVERSDVDALMKSVSGTTTTQALASLTSDTGAMSKFSQLFGASPTVLLSAKPEVLLTFPSSTINELAVAHFSVTTSHVNPNYSFVYKWKIDGTLKSSGTTLNYIPGANDSGSHQVDLFVGLNDGAGDIDLSKPYFLKTQIISVNNNTLPTPPDIAINPGTPSPVTTNSIHLDLSTGVNKTNCASFSHLAITDSATPPGVMQFTIDCSTAGTQIENVSFSSGDGAKTLYLWAVDNEGVISGAKTVSLVLDMLPPAASLGFTPSSVRGGLTQSISINASDAGSGLNTLDLYFSANNGATYSLLSHLSNSDTSYSWTVPAIDTIQGKLKLVATDLIGSVTAAYSSVFEIDSAAPAAPTIARSSSASSNSSTVGINTTCIGDYHKILYSQTSSTPSLTNAAWETCSSTKNFTVTTGDALKTIYAFTKDAVGNISASSNITMTLDTTAPAAPVANLTSASVSSSTAVSFTISDCTDRPYVFVSESVIAPAAGDSGWQSCVTSASATTYTLVGPVLQNSHTLYVYAKDAVGNVGAATSASMIYDTTNPALTLSTSLGLLYKGGDVISLSFGTSDTNGLSNFKLEYAADGSTYALVTNLSTSATTYNWTVPANNTTTAKIRLVATDNATTANVTTVYSDAFTVDSTAPSAPTLTRTSNAISNSTSVTMTVGSCTDTSHLLISETNSQPSVSDSSWQLCSTSASAFSKTVSGDGVHTIYAWAKDLAGNIASSANSVTMTLDTTAPVITVTTPSSMQGNVSTGSVSWTLTEANVAASTDFIVEIFDGTSWVNVGTKAATAGVNTGQAYTLSSFAVPNVDVTTGKVRVTLADAAGNSVTSETGAFTIDSTKPTVNSLQVAGGSSTTAVPTIAFTISATDNLSSVSQIQITESSTPASNAWVTYVTSGNFNLTQTNGVKTVYAFVKDIVGNISVASTTNITMSFGAPPVVNFTSPISSNTYAANDTVAIAWTCSPGSGSTLGLASQPISTIQYTTDDGATFADIAGAQNLTNNSTSTTGTFNWIIPSGGLPPSNGGATSGVPAFRLSITCKDAAGVASSAMSQFLNTGGWSVFMGDPWNGVANINALNADLSTTYSATNGATNSQLHSLTADSNNNIYYVKNDMVMKIDATTNLVTTFAGNVTSAGCTMTGGSSPLSTTLTKPQILGKNAAGTGMIIWNAGCSTILQLAWNGTVTLLNNTITGMFNPMLTKNMQIFYLSSGGGTSPTIYKVDLTSINSAKVMVAGINSGTCGSIGAIGSDARLSEFNCSTGSMLIYPSYDGNKIFIDSYSGSTNAIRFDYNSSLGYYVVGSTNVGWRSTNSNCVFVDFNNYLHCPPWHAGRQFQVLNTTTETWIHTESIPFSNSDNAGFLSIGSLPDKLLIRYSLNTIQTANIVYGTTPSTFTTVAGQPITIFGNGTDPSQVAFYKPDDIVYNSTIQKLLISPYGGGHIRKVDFSTSPYSTSTTFGYLRMTFMNIDLAGTFLDGFNSCASVIFVRSSLSTGASNSYPIGPNGCAITAPQVQLYPAPDNLSASLFGRYIYPSLGSAGALTYLPAVGVGAPQSRLAIHTNGKTYFSAMSTSGANVFIYSTDGTTIRTVAGKMGTAGYVSTDSGNAALGSSLCRVYHIQEIASGPYQGDLLAYDCDRLRRISITTESSAPKLYDVVYFPTVGGVSTGYTAGTYPADFYYDSTSEMSNGTNNVLGSGKMYYVTSNNVVRKFSPSTVSGDNVTAATDTAYSFSGTTFPASATGSGVSVRIALSPAGLLVLQPNKNRILKVAP